MEIQPESLLMFCEILHFEAQKLMKECNVPDDFRSLYSKVFVHTALKVTKEYEKFMGDENMIKKAKKLADAVRTVTTKNPEEIINLGLELLKDKK
jgi:hypothetical protein